MIFTGVAGSRVIARQPNSAPVRLRGKWVSPYPLASNRDDLSGRSLAGPQIVLNGGAVAVKATPLRGRFEAEPGQPPHHRANRPLPARGGRRNTPSELRGESRVSNSCARPASGYIKAPDCAPDLRRGQSEPASTYTVILAHCNDGVARFAAWDWPRVCSGCWQ
jgi:hypothetical protein